MMSRDLLGKGLRILFLFKIALLQILSATPVVVHSSYINPYLLTLADHVSEERLMGYVENLTGFGTRYALSDKANASAMYLYRHFADLEGFNTTLHYFSMSTARGVTGLNVVALKPGLGRGMEYVLLVAHYDSISYDPYVSAPGANDNAGGVAALMEIGLISSRVHLARSLMLVAFSGEEVGLAGSASWVRDNKEVLKNAAGVICLDGVARGDGISIMYADDRSRVLAQAVLNVSLALGYKNFRVLLSNPGVLGSDSGSFLGAGPPVIRLWDENTTFIHTPQDRLEALNPSRLVEATKTALATAYMVANDTQDIILPKRSPDSLQTPEQELDRAAFFYGVVLALITSYIFIRVSRLKRPRNLSQRWV